MKQIKGIYTVRDTLQPSYWDIVFEWEDNFSKTLGVPLIPVGNRYDKIYQPTLQRKILNRLNVYQLMDKYLVAPKGFYIAFHIGPPGAYSFYTRKDVIPIIIDFWKNENIKRFESIFRHSHAVFVTSREVYNYLTSKKVNLRLQHVSLSLPDQYLSSEESVVKDIDIIQIGRSNSTLDRYMSQFLDDFPNTHYLSAKKTGNDIHFISNKFGSIGMFRERSGFLNLLKRSKISLVSAPGLGEDNNRTGGFSPVTPRFFESAACRCKMVGVYPDNDDFRYLKINKICKNVTNYSEFTEAITRSFSEETPDFTEFLKPNITSERAMEVKLKLQKRHDC